MSVLLPLRRLGLPVARRAALLVSVPSGPALRDYQSSIIGRVAEAFAVGHRSVLAVAPTGAGKTVVIAAIVRERVARGERVLVCAHRKELLWQASEKLTAAGVEHGIIAPGAAATDHPVQVASVQTLARRPERATGYALVIIDEAHHSVAGAWAGVIAANPDADILGLTATPERLDGRGLGRAAGGCFDALVLGPTIAELQARRFLVRARVFAPPGQPDLTGVRKVAGDWERGGLEKVMGGAQLVGDAVEHYRRLAPGRAAIAFCASVAHARQVAEAFRAAGFRAVAADGSMGDAERDAAIAGLADGTVEVLCCCDLISEGLDVPGVEVVILLRPTQSLCLHVQQVGRGLRPAAGKDALLVLDHAGNVFRHGMPDRAHEWSLGGKAKKDRAAPRVAQCPNCFACHAPAPRCPGCGHDYAEAAMRRPRRSLRQIVGELRELGAHAQADALEAQVREEEAAREAAAEARREYLRSTPLHEILGVVRSRQELFEVAKARGYKPGWVYHKAEELRLPVGGARRAA